MYSTYDLGLLLFSNKKKATKIDSHWFHLQTKKALGFVFQFYVDCLFIYLSIYQSIHQSIHQSISLSLLLLLSYCTLTVLTVFCFIHFFPFLDLFYPREMYRCSSSLLLCQLMSNQTQLIGSRDTTTSSYNISCQKVALKNSYKEAFNLSFIMFIFRLMFYVMFKRFIFCNYVSDSVTI